MLSTKNTQLHSWCHNVPHCRSTICTKMCASVATIKQSSCSIQSKTNTRLHRTGMSVSGSVLDRIVTVLWVLLHFGPGRLDCHLTGGSKLGQVETELSLHTCKCGSGQMITTNVVFGHRGKALDGRFGSGLWASRTTEERPGYFIKKILGKMYLLCSLTCADKTLGCLSLFCQHLKFLISGKHK